jgi:uncharacterized protein (TIGR00255 family)
MLRSMTGFGSAGGRVEGIEYAVEIRSVNHRYFKAAIKLPESWASADVEIEQKLRHKLQRGAVTCTVRMKIPDDQAAYRVNTVALNSYIEQLRGLEIEANPTMRIELGALLQLPGVCEPPPLEEMIASTHDRLMGFIDQALEQLLQMRQREGGALRDDLLVNCDVIGESLKIVSARAPEVLREYHARLAARVAELTHAAQIKLDEDQLIREVAIFAERCDIAEEIARLAGHVEHFRAAADSPEPAGRKLDFIAQEMLREANTIASKSNDVDIARSVVEIKTAIDRIKEQVQNVE